MHAFPFRSAGATAPVRQRRAARLQEKSRAARLCEPGRGHKAGRLKATCTSCVDFVSALTPARGACTIRCTTCRGRFPCRGHMQMHIRGWPRFHAHARRTAWTRGHRFHARAHRMARTRRGWKHQIWKSWGLLIRRLGGVLVRLGRQSRAKRGLGQWLWEDLREIIGNLRGGPTN